MVTKTETLHAGSFLVSEGNGAISREKVTVLSGQNLLAGAVVGKLSVGAAVGAAIAGNTGNGTIGSVTLGVGAVPGVYKALFIEPATNAGTFIVEGPDGIEIGKGNVAVAFAGPINFTIADGATDFVSGDGFTITVAAGSGKYVKYDDTAATGADVAAGILYDDCDASLADKGATIIARNAEVVKSALVWDATQDAGKQANGIVDLAKLGIIAR